MQLSLQSEKNVSILSVKGTLLKKDIPMIFAGIRKLFRDGKNRMILELPESAQITSDDLRELVQLNLLAAELAGEIVFSAIDENTQHRINGFSSPPFMKCFHSRAEAMAHFSPKVDPLTQLPPQGKQPAPTETHREAFVHKEVSELGPLRKQIEKLEKENRALAHQLQSSLFTHREPATSDQWKKKVEYLEEELKKSLQKTP
jgi:hypothetical protein